MANVDYEVGQFVKVDIPDTYGRIIEILEKPISLELQSWKKGGKIDNSKVVIKHIIYSGGVVIEYRKPIGTLGAEKVEKSTYLFEHPVFGKAFHAINPEEEIKALEERLRVTTKSSEEIKETINYIIFNSKSI